VQGSSSVVGTSTLVDQSHDGILKTVWKIIYWILALFFLGFGILALIGGSEWWGVIFIINGILFINSSTSLNGKNRKILDREIVYLVLVLFFCFFGILITLASKSLSSWWWCGIVFFFIMTIFSILSTSLNEESKVSLVIEKFYKKISSLSFVSASPVSDSPGTYTKKGYMLQLRNSDLFLKYSPHLKKIIVGAAGIILTVVVEHFLSRLFP
jgi:hypothetical protein